MTFDKSKSDEARWLRWSIAFVWLATGLSVAHPYYRGVGQDNLAPLGLPDLLMYVTCAGEVMLGLRVALGGAATWLTVLQVGMIATFTVILAAVDPRLLVHPYGVLAKNLPLAAMILSVWLWEREGWSRRNLWLLRIGLASIWITEALFPKILFPQQQAIALARHSGLVPGDPERFLLVMGVIQTLIGLLALVLRGGWFRLLLLGQVLALVILPLMVGGLDPNQWVHPFGPLIKNAPLLVGTLVLYRRWQ